VSCKNFYGGLVAQYLAGACCCSGQPPHLLSFGSLVENQFPWGSTGGSVHWWIHWYPTAGAVGISKIGPHLKLFLQTGMQVMFAAIIQRGGFTRQLGQSAEEPELYRTGFFGPDLRHLVGKDQARYSLYLSVNSGLWPSPTIVSPSQ
jgi:hypothetical protein